MKRTQESCDKESKVKGCLLTLRDLKPLIVRSQVGCYIGQKKAFCMQVKNSRAWLWVGKKLSTDILIITSRGKEENQAT